MNLSDLQAQFDELDRLSSSGGVEVSLSPRANSILATKKVSAGGTLGDLLSVAPEPRELNDLDLSQGSWPMPNYLPQVDWSGTGDITGHDGGSDLGRRGSQGNEPERHSYGRTEFYPNDTRNQTKVTPPTIGEQVLKVDFTDVDVPDGFIDEQMKLAYNKRRRGFLPEVELVGHGASGIWEVAKDYKYTVDYFSIGREVPPTSFTSLADMEPSRLYGGVPKLCTLTATKGFQFDRASVPRIFWVIISKDDLSNVPPLFHDLLYRFAGKLPGSLVDPYTDFSRAEADHLFYHLMERSGVTSWRLHVAYQAVARLASFAWGKKPV